MKVCECGCKTKIPKINKKGKLARFAHGHNNRGVKWSVNVKDKVSSSLKKWYKNVDSSLLKDRYIKISNSNKGKSATRGSFKTDHKTWNKGKIGYLAGEQNSNWKGGKALMNGYWFIRIDRGVYKKRSRIEMETHLGKKLSSHDIVHHINGDKADDRIENLQLMTRKEHINLHYINCDIISLWPINLNPHKMLKEQL